MTMNTEIAIAVLIFIAGAAIAALVFWLRERSDAGAKARVLGYRDTYEPLFADLWSDEMHRRLTALVVAQRMARSRSAARGLGDVLISFIRRRLAAAGSDASYEDVRLMLEKMADRLFEHPATVLVITNLYYAEAPWLTPRSASASRQSVGHACGGPKLWTSSVAPSCTSETASSAVSQRRVMGMAGAHPTIARGRARRVAVGLWKLLPQGRHRENRQHVGAVFRQIELLAVGSEGPLPRELPAGEGTQDGGIASAPEAFL